jgi:hypothetical protein
VVPPAEDGVAVPDVLDSCVVAGDASWGVGRDPGARCTVDEAGVPADPGVVAEGVELPPADVRGPGASSVDSGIGESTSGGAVTGTGGAAAEFRGERGVLGGVGAEAPEAVRCTGVPAGADDADVWLRVSGDVMGGPNRERRRTVRSG